MITASSVAKYAPPLTAAAAVIDWQLAGAIAFGFGSGWAARAAAKISKRESSASILRDFLVSVLISGGSLLLVLWIVRFAQLDQLGAAVVAFTMAMGGVKLLDTLHREATEWLRRKLTDVDAVQAEKRQEAQKMIAAHRLAQKEADGDE